MKDYETSYVYKAQESARERAAKKAFEDVSGGSGGGGGC